MVVMESRGSAAYEFLQQQQLEQQHQELLVDALKKAEDNMEMQAEKQRAAKQNAEHERAAAEDAEHEATMETAASEAMASKDVDGRPAKKARVSEVGMQ